jgi:hypothetical protein
MEKNIVDFLFINSRGTYEEFLDLNPTFRRRSIARASFLAISQNFQIIFDLLKECLCLRPEYFSLSTPLDLGFQKFLTWAYEKRVGVMLDLPWVKYLFSLMRDGIGSPQIAFPPPKAPPEISGPGIS